MQLVARWSFGQLPNVVAVGMWFGDLLLLTLFWCQLHRRRTRNVPWDRIDRLVFNRLIAKLAFPHTDLAAVVKDANAWGCFAGLVSVLN